MSQENPKRILLRQTSIMKSKSCLKPKKIQTKLEIQESKKLPLLKQRKYASSNNIVISSTCEIPSSQQDITQCSNFNKLKKTLDHKKQEACPQSENGSTNLKHFFKKRKITIEPLVVKSLRKYSSYSKLSFLPNISNLKAENDEYLIQGQNQEDERVIKSMNSIQLQTIQQAKRPRMQRMTLKKLLKSQMSKTINPKKEADNSIEIQKENAQNQEKLMITKKRSRMSKFGLDRLDSKTKILVKNPFDKLPKKHQELVQKFEILEKLQALEKQFRLSEIFQDQNDESEMSVSSKNDIENMIGLMNM